MRAKLNQTPFPVEHPSSDADLAVQTNLYYPMNARERVEFALAVEDLLEVPRVDLVILDECDAFLALDVIRGELLYAEDPDAQAREELFILRRAADLAPFERERINTLLAR